MTRHKDREYSQQLFDNVQAIAGRAGGDFTQFAELDAQWAGELRKMKKFRFQLLHRWLVERFEPCRVADIGGGKGLLAYLLQRDGWSTAVIDPIYQDLINKYKDITTGKRIKIAPDESVPHINKPFATKMGQDFDLLIGMHAHGCNAQIIDAARQYGCGFVIFPCCVIDEPFFPVIGVDWLECITDYAVWQESVPYTFRLNFKGQNIGLCHIGSRCQVKSG